MAATTWDLAWAGRGRLAASSIKRPPLDQRLLRGRCRPVRRPGRRDGRHRTAAGPSRVALVTGVRHSPRWADRIRLGCRLGGVPPHRAPAPTGCSRSAGCKNVVADLAGGEAYSDLRILIGKLRERKTKGSGVFSAEEKTPDPFVFPIEHVEHIAARTESESSWHALNLLQPPVAEKPKRLPTPFYLAVTDPAS